MIAQGKINFTNLSRYSQISERTYRRQFAKEFDFPGFNGALVEAVAAPAHRLLGVMDASFVPKSGKATFGLDYFWNGSASRADQGLEVSLIGVVDVEAQQGYALSAQQTFAQSEVPDLSRLEQAIYHLETARPQLNERVKYLAVDGAYAKAPFVEAAVEMNLAVISKLRRDANLRYLYNGEQKPKGRPCKYDGKVDLSDPSRLTWVETLPSGVELYSAVVFAVALKRSIRLVYLLDNRDPTHPRWVLLFSTDIHQDPKEIYQMYKLRFQVEFIFRDAKQFTGLSDCQARDAQKLEFHFNASVTALNLAKLNAYRQHSGEKPFVFSMATVKRRALVEHLLDTFITQLDLDPTLIKSHPNFQNLCSYGAIVT